MELAIPQAAFDGFTDETEKHTAVCVITDFAIKEGWSVVLRDNFIHFSSVDKNEKQTCNSLELSKTLLGNKNKDDRLNTDKKIFKRCPIKIRRYFRLIVRYLSQDKHKNAGKIALQSTLQEPLKTYRQLTQLDKSKMKEAIFLASQMYQIYLKGNHTLLQNGDMNPSYFLKNSIDFAFYELLQWYLKFNPSADPRTTSNTQVLSFFKHAKCQWLHLFWMKLFLCRQINSKLAALKQKTDMIQETLLESMANQSEDLIHSKMEIKAELSSAIRKLEAKVELDTKNVGIQYKKHLLEERFNALKKQKEKLLASLGHMDVKN